VGVVMSHPPRAVLRRIMLGVLFALLALLAYGSIIAKVGTHGADEFLARVHGKAYH